MSWCVDWPVGRIGIKSGDEGNSIDGAVSFPPAFGSHLTSGPTFGGKHRLGRLP